MLLCWTPGALIGGTLMSKIGARNAMLLGAVLFPLGTLTSSFVPQSSPWLLYVTFSFLQGLGNGLAYTVATYVSTGWYPDKRGLVSGLCMAFTGGSSAFLAPICSKLVQSTGIISTLRIVGLVSLVVCVVCALGVRQAPVGYTPAGFAGSASSAETQLESYNVRRALKTRPIWHLIVCTAFFPTMYMIMFPRFSVYMTDAGFTLSAATLGVSIYFIANTLSRLFLGALCDKISYKHVYGICGVLCILSAICLIAAHSLFLFYLGSALRRHQQRLPRHDQQVLRPGLRRRHLRRGPVRLHDLLHAHHAAHQRRARCLHRRLHRLVHLWHRALVRRRCVHVPDPEGGSQAPRCGREAGRICVIPIGRGVNIGRHRLYPWFSDRYLSLL